MPIRKINRAGTIRYKTVIRRRGFPAVFQTFDRYADAKAFEDRTLREQTDRAAYGCRVSLTLGEVIEAYIESDEYAALRSDRSQYHAHWKARLGKIKLASLNRNTFQHEADELAKGGRSKATVAIFMSALGTELKYGTRKMFADARALAEFRCCTFSCQSKVRGRALEPDEVRALLVAADNAKWKHWPLVVRLLLMTAGCKSDIFQRRRCDVDPDAGTILVPVSKNGDAKTMIVPPGEVLDLLKVRCEGLADDALLFPGRKATTALDPKKSWPKLVKDAGLPAECSLHWLRKTSITCLLRAGVDVASVAKVSVDLRFDFMTTQAVSLTSILTSSGPACRVCAGVR